jgi:hypothetical protein
MLIRVDDNAWLEPAAPCVTSAPRAASRNSSFASIEDTTFREMIPRLAVVALTTAPMPYRLLKLADVQA